MIQNSQTLLKLLPERLWTIPDRAWLHKEIKRARESKARFKTIHAGRRSYKSEIFGRRWLVGKCLENQNQAWFYGGPTYRQVKMIAWNAIKLLSPTWAVKNISETELRIDYKNGSELWLIGFDKRQRFEGKEIWHGGAIDEYAQMEKEVWDNTVEPALRDSGGPCNFIGKPEGKNHYFELSQYALKSGDPEWDDFCWWTEDVLDPIEIEKARARLDERTFLQEYHGDFVSYEGRAYIYYSSDAHRKPQSFDPKYPITVCCDFNLDPCIWLVLQDKNGFISILEEIKQRQTDIWRMCNTLKERLISRVGHDKQTLYFYGDFEHGKTRSVSATNTSWQIIRDEFKGWGAEFRLKTHPRIVDRVNSVNSKLRTAKGEAKLGLDPSCIELHKDFEMVDMGMLQSISEKGKNPDRTHASDALGYFIEFEYPVIRIETSVM